MRPKNCKPLLGTLSVLLGITHMGCGGSRPAPVINISVVVLDSAMIQVGKTGRFAATVTVDPVSADLQNAGVNWTVSCAASSCGSVSPPSTANNGSTTYTAPANLPHSDLTVTLTATSTTQASARGSVTIIVPSVEVAVAPVSVTVPAGGTTEFTATVIGDASNSGVAWNLAIIECGLGGCLNVCSHNMNSCGTISSGSSASGVPITYTAPASPPALSLFLAAVSAADGNAFFHVPITVSSSSHSIPADVGDATHEEPASQPVHYKVINLGTLGGSTSNGFGGVNDRGSVTGDANLAGDQNEHGALWRDGAIIDLGTLGGPNSSVPFPVKDDRGLVVGVAQTAGVDPLSELWGNTFACTSAICQGSENLVRGFVWKDGVMTALPTLGGNNNGALGVNKLGQIVGGAETANQDPNCVPPQVLDVGAVVWGPQPGQIEALPTFPGDSSAVALAINDQGQVVGTSGQCQGPPSGLAFQHAVLWQHGTVTNLGSLGGAMFNAANGINNRGQVVGQSDLPGETATHAFLWQNGVMTDLRTLPGDSNSVAFDINDKGQVVGNSCDVNFNCRPFLWEDGVMTDLNTLIPPNSPLHLTFGAGINDRGEIAGSACVVSNGACTNELPAFLAIPCDEEHSSHEACADDVAEQAPRPAIVRSGPIILPDHINQQVRGRGFGHFAAGPATPQ
jgi:probable HAF family extracellular repeat protein